MRPTSPDSSPALGAPDAPADSDPRRRCGCPRCGYDLRGVVATWRDTCPLDGRCTECGLDFRWDEVVRPDRAVPRWCTEFARRRALPKAIVATSVRAFAPGPFWRRLRMHFGFQPVRLVGHVAGVVALAYLVFAVFHGVALHRTNTWLGFGDRELVAAIGAIAPFDDGAIIRFVRPRVGSVKSTSRELLDTEHRVLTSLTRTIAGAPQACDYLDPGPSLLALEIVAVTLLATLLAPASFGLLPQSLRRANVRPGHVARGAAYSTAILLPALAVVLVITWDRVFVTPWYQDEGVLARIALGIAAALPLALATWWVAVARHYLRLPHARAVGLALCVVSLLVATGVLAAPVVVDMLATGASVPRP